jgi:serine/threonine protein kinase
MCRDRIAVEITALRRIHSTLVVSTNRNVARHLPTFIGADPIEDGGSRWLSVHPIPGFNLERLRVVVTHIVSSSSGASATRTLPFPAIPEVLLLHIAKQLTKAVEWLHNVANISHNDVFGGNVMLDMSASNKESGFIMPTVVLIDFDRATLHPNDREKGIDRSFVYELIHLLDGTGRASSRETDSLKEDTIVLEGLMTWWDVFTRFLAINKSQYLQEASSSSAQFRERFGVAIDRRLEDIADEEERQVQELLDMVVKKEVRFPSEERIRDALGQWEDGQVLVVVQKTR